MNIFSIMSLLGDDLYRGKSQRIGAGKARALKREAEYRAQQNKRLANAPKPSDVPSRQVSRQTERKWFKGMKPRPAYEETQVINQARRQRAEAARYGE